MVENREQHTSIRSLIYGKIDESRRFTATLLFPQSTGIATLLASRGVDMGIDKDVEAAGGLHVICTFFPQNQRVQAQVFGRTARSGKPGTGEMILLLSDVQQVLGDSFPQDGRISTELISKIRDKIVDENLKTHIRDQLPLSKLRGKLYTKMCKAMTKFRKMAQNKNVDEVEVKLDKNGKIDPKQSDKKATKKQPKRAPPIMTDDVKYALRQIEELWAFWFDAELKRLQKIKKENATTSAK